MFSSLFHSSTLLPILAAIFLTVAAASSSDEAPLPLPLRWRPFNMHRSGLPAAAMAGMETGWRSEGEEFAPPRTGRGMQQQQQHVLPRNPTSPVRVSEVKSFVEGLKSRIKNEISLLLALADEEVEAQVKQETGGETKLRDYFVNEDNSRLRKFLPLPLLKGSRH